MKRNLPPENTVRVLVVAIAFFGAFALLGWNAGVFARLDESELAVLAGFVAGFAVLTYLVDGQVRRVMDGAASALWHRHDAKIASASHRAGVR